MLTVISNPESNVLEKQTMNNEHVLGASYFGAFGIVGFSADII